MISVEQACARVGLTAAPADWVERWPQSEGSYRPGSVAFLQPTFVQAACRALGIGPDLEETLAAAAAGVAADPVLERLACHCHWLLFCSGVDIQARLWPPITVAAHPSGPLFYAVVFLSGLPFTERVHRARGIAPEITSATLSDLAVWLREHKRRYGSGGFRETGWLPFHFQGRLFKLGRLQFLPGQYEHPFRFFRRAADRSVAGLAADELLFREDGQFASADGGRVRDALWRSSFAVDDKAFRGHPVTPEGRVQRQTVELRRTEWVEILRRGDPVMTVHIAATGPLDPDACRASFRQAVVFFGTHFPDWHYRAFTCDSWLLDPQMERLVPPPARIVAFQREWFLHPVAGAADGQTLERVFTVLDGRPPALGDLPQTTSLQCAMVAFMRAGGRFRMGGSVLFPEDLDGAPGVYRAPGPANRM